MQLKRILSATVALACILASACGPALQTVEVTRLVPETEVVTRLATRLVSMQVSTTPLPTGTPTPSRTPASISTFFVPLTITPGMEVITNNTRPDVEKFVSAQNIKDYLVMNYGITVFGGKVFCAYQPMGMENDGQTIQTIKLYLWIVCAEYYLKNQKLEMGSAASIPVVLIVKIRWGEYRIVDTLDPGWGYELVKINFPPEIQKIIFADIETHNNRADTLIHEVEEEANAYFGN